ncbi:hypothetical protein PMEGAS67_09250 [Priestia megaterium]
MFPQDNMKMDSLRIESFRIDGVDEPMKELENSITIKRQKSSYLNYVYFKGRLLIEHL